MRLIKKGATSQSIYFEVLDNSSTTGGRKTGLAYNTASLKAYYVRNQNSATSITLATLAAANSSWSSGGFKEVDATNMPGVYRLDIPNAALATGADSVVITLQGASGMAQVSHLIQLTDIDLQDAVRGGLTALPNANAEASGGLFTRGTGAGQINQDSNGRIDTNTKAWAGTATTLTSSLPDVNTKTITDGIITAATFASNALDAVWSTATRVLTAGTNIVLAKGTGITGLNDLDASGIRTAVGLASANLDTQFTGVNTNIDDIETYGDSNWTTATGFSSAGDAMTLTTGERAAVADAILDRDMSAGTDSGSDSFRTMRQALRFLRNKWTIVAGVLSVKKEDDSTDSWTATVGGTSGADPVTSVDPDGP